MKALLALLAGFSLSISAQATPSPELIKSTLEAQPTCGNFVRFDDANIYQGFGYYSNGPEKPRVSAPAKISVTPLNGGASFDLVTQDSAIDLISDNNGKALVLTYTGIEAWNVKERRREAIYLTHVNTYFGDMEHPRAFARYQDKIIIAHGRLGVSILDLQTLKVQNYFGLIDQGQLESTATGVAVAGQYAYVILDSYTLVERNAKPPFRGIVVIDMETGRMVNQLNGMDPGADSVSAIDGNLFVSFMGQPIWKYRLNSLMGTKLPEPAKRVWKFPWEGRAVGAAALDAKYYYTCFSKMPGPGEGIYFKRKPVALDRRILMLD